MRILVGCEMTYTFSQPTPVIATLNVHASRVSDLERPDHLVTSPSVPLEGYRDSFGNWCQRMTAPTGVFTLKTETIVRDEGKGDRPVPDAAETPGLPPFGGPCSKLVHRRSRDDGRASGRP